MIILMGKKLQNPISSADETRRLPLCCLPHLWTVIQTRDHCSVTQALVYVGPFLPSTDAAVDHDTPFYLAHQQRQSV